jgi:hypothetical protein
VPFVNFAVGAPSADPVSVTTAFETPTALPASVTRPRMMAVPGVRTTGCWGGACPACTTATMAPAAQVRAMKRTMVRIRRVGRGRYGLPSNSPWDRVLGSHRGVDHAHETGPSRVLEQLAIASHERHVVFACRRDENPVNGVDQRRRRNQAGIHRNVTIDVDDAQATAIDGLSNPFDRPLE